MDEEQIITLFFARSEQAIEALDAKYGKLFHSLSYHTVSYTHLTLPTICSV